MSSEFSFLKSLFSPAPVTNSDGINLQPQRRSPIPIPFQPPTQQYLSPYASANAEASLLSISAPQLTQSSSSMSGPTITDMVRDVIARAEAKAAKDKEAARNAAEGDTQVPVDAEAFIVARTPAMEPRNEARTGGRRGRGPRRRGSPLAMGTIKVEPSMVGGSESPGRARGRGKGGRPRGSRASTGGRGSLRGGKRKRSLDEDDENDDSDASETFAPLPTQSRSGRKIFQANTNAPIIKVDDEGTLAGPSPSLLLQPTLTVLDKGNKKRRRTPGATAVCKNCGRGHSPASNVIAFCDGCNTPWHQHCHNPPIKSEIVQIEEKEWFCADCTVLREESQRLAGRVAGEGMSLAEVCIGEGSRGGL